MYYQCLENRLCGHMERRGGQGELFGNFNMSAEHVSMCIWPGISLEDRGVYCFAGRMAVLSHENQKARWRGRAESSPSSQARSDRIFAQQYKMGIRKRPDRCSSACNGFVSVNDQQRTSGKWHVRLRLAVTGAIQNCDRAIAPRL